MEPTTLYKLCLLLGMLSILVSLLYWIRAKGATPEDQARRERLSLFVGLWAPSLFALASYFRFASKT